jgi:hypothetical protein
MKWVICRDCTKLYIIHEPSKPKKTETFKCKETIKCNECYVKEPRTMVQNKRKIRSRL